MEEENCFDCVPRSRISERISPAYLYPNDPVIALSEGIGGYLRNALVDFIAFYRNRKPSIFPTELLPYYRDGSLYSRVDMSGANPGVHGICAILEKLDLTVIAEDDEQVLDVTFPNQVSTDHMSAEMMSSMSCASHGTIQKLSGVYGSNVVDYVVRKYDGQSVHNYAIMTDYNMYGLAHYDGNLVLNSYEEAFSGEIVGDRIYFQHVYNASGPICLNEKFYECVDTEELTSIATAIDCEEVDGLVFCVNSIEYKVKEINTIDLLNTGSTCFMTSDGFKYYSREPTEFTAPIVECEVMRTGHVFPIKDRFDKKKAQSSSECVRILDSPTLTDLRNILGDHEVAVGGGVLYVPPDICAELVRQELKYTNGRARISHQLITTILHERGIYVDASLCSLILKVLGISSKLGVVVAGVPFSKQSVVSVTVREIYKAIQDYNITGTLHDLGLYLSTRHDMVINSLDLWYMHRNKLFKVRHNKCVGLNKWNPDKMSNDIVARYWLKYGYNNESTHAQNLLGAITSETDELLMANSPIDIRDEIGDVILVLFRYVGLGKYPTKVQSLLALSLFSSVKEKYKLRILKHGCIRNHDTAESHVCSNGNQFLGKID